MKLDWREGVTISWGRPDSPRRLLCAICHGALPQAPLILWEEDGKSASFCDQCVGKWLRISDD
jgi:hypothetical protein